MTKETYVCWNCKETATYGKPHACDTDQGTKERTRADFARIARAAKIAKGGNDASRN